MAFWWLRPPAVTVVEARNAPLVRTVQFSGRVASAARVDVGATLTGRAAQVLVDEGDAVRRGQVLLRLETDELRAAAEQAQASERQAVARLAGLRGPARSGAGASLAQAESVLLAARAELKRTEELVATGFLSPARLDEVRRAVSVAEAQVDGARAQAQAVSDQGSEVAQAQAQLGAAQAARAAAQARLAQAELVAPADARVLARQVEPGQIVQPGRALLTLALSGPVRLVAQVDERFLGQLRTGQAAMVVADAFPTQRFGARVTALAPLVDAQRGSIEVEFAVPDAAPPILREDMTLSIEVETARLERALMLPLAALSGTAAEASNAVVQVVQGGRLVDRPVALGIRTLEAIEIRDGLSAGEQVVVGSRGRAGDRVRSVEQPLHEALAAPRGPGAPDGGAAGALTRAVGR